MGLGEEQALQMDPVRITSNGSCQIWRSRKAAFGTKCFSLSPPEPDSKAGFLPVVVTIQFFSGGPKTPGFFLVHLLPPESELDSRFLLPEALKLFGDAEKGVEVHV